MADDGPLLYGIDYCAPVRSMSPLPTTANSDHTFILVILLLCPDRLITISIVKSLLFHHRFLRYPIIQGNNATMQQCNDPPDSCYQTLGANVIM